MTRRFRPAALLASLVACAIAHVAPAQVFTDVTIPAGLGNPLDVQGVAWADADGDGDLDAYLTLVLSSFLGVGNQLYRNEGPDPTGMVTFTDVAVAAGVADEETSFGACFADYDGDADQDLIVANGANAALPNALKFYVNDGTGSFVEEGRARGLGAPGSGRSVVASDYDDDGDIDFFLCTPDLVLFGERYYLFRNDGSVFTDVTAETGLDTRTLNTDAAAWADYDRDGDEDLFVSNHGNPPLTEPNQLWQNQLAQTGRATFVDVAPGLGLDDRGASTGAAWGDCDNDGDLDLYVATGLDIFSIFGINAPNRLYRNESDGTFTEIALVAGLPGTDVAVRSQVSFSAAWGDLDRDGWLDIYVTNSRLNTSDPSNVLLRNVGNCTFEEVDAGVDDPGSGQGTALADHDRDGDLDIFVANLFSSSDVTARLYRNDSPPQRWLVVTLEGVVSNRDGIGALITAVVGTKRYTRHVYAGSGYLSQDSVESEFGLAQAPSIDRLEITWPSGCFQVVEAPPIDARIHVVEDCVPGFDRVSVSDDPCTRGLTVDWDPAAFPSGTGHYEVRRGATCADAEMQPELLPRPTAPPFVDAGTTPGTAHAYVVIAVDDVNGTTSRQCVAPTLDEVAAGPMVDADSLRVRRIGTDVPELRWTFTGTGVFEVRRNLDRFAWAGGPGGIPLVATPAATPWPDPTIPLMPGQVAYYQVFGAGCP